MSIAKETDGHNLASVSSFLSHMHCVIGIYCSGAPVLGVPVELACRISIEIRHIWQRGAAYLGSLAAYLQPLFSQGLTHFAT